MSGIQCRALAHQAVTSSTIEQVSIINLGVRLTATQQITGGVDVDEGAELVTLCLGGNCPTASG